MRRTRVFLDSSVVIAGLASKTGGSHKILALAEMGIITPYISEDVVSEVLRNVRKKLPDCEALFYTLFKTLPFKIADGSDKDIEYAKKFINEKDAVIMAAAVSSKAEWLLSLDRHFLAADWTGKFNFVVCSPGDFFERFVIKE